MNKKNCCKCKKQFELTTEFFYRDRSTKSGFSARCKKCARLHLREMQEKHPETFKRKNHKWYLKNRKKLLNKMASRYLINKDKIYARHKVERALYAGVITRRPCDICGENSVEAHHDDYSKPLEVRWLCKKHHRRLHADKD